MKPCARFGAMIATSKLLMLGLIHQNTSALDRVFFGEIRGLHGHPDGQLDGGGHDGLDVERV
jgi:hypothetical protein